MGISSLLQPIRKRAFVIACFGIALALPCLCALCAYLSGWGSVSFGLAFLLGMLTFVSGPILALVFLGRSWARNKDNPPFWPGNFLLAVALFFLPYIVLFAFRPMAALMGEGFGDCINSRAPFDQLQGWAMDVLARHERGELKTKPYPCSSVLADEEVPDPVKGLWTVPPDEVLAFREENGPPYVEVRWQRHGLLVGAPGSRIGGRFFYLRQLRPGVYVYVRER